MKRYLTLFSALCFAATACADAPTLPLRSVRDAPLRSSATDYSVIVSVPDTLVADVYTKTCDISMTVTSGSYSTADWGPGSIVAAGQTYNLSAAAFNGWMGPIAPGYPGWVSHTGVLSDASLSPAHGVAPYDGVVNVSWVNYGITRTGSLPFHCEPNPTAPEPPAPPSDGGDYCITQPGQNSVRTLASKRTRYGYQIGCTGIWQFETMYEFRSTDAWICYTDMPTYYAYNVGDDAECGWYAG